MGTLRGKRATVVPPVHHLRGTLRLMQTVVFGDRTAAGAEPDFDWRPAQPSAAPWNRQSQAAVFEGEHILGGISGYDAAETTRRV